jgi:hypothetical protein
MIGQKVIDCGNCFCEIATKNDEIKFLIYLWSFFSLILIDENYLNLD